EGYSGGGLFTKDHELLGIITLEESPYTLALSIERILQEARDWNYPNNIFEVKKKRKPWPWVAAGAGVVAALDCFVTQAVICKPDEIADPPDRPSSQ
ncbi:MAG: hypothetical protein AAF564_22610, partial [Bacteroidota bacterium]